MYMSESTRRRIWNRKWSENLILCNKIKPALWRKRMAQLILDGNCEFRVFSWAPTSKNRNKFKDPGLIRKLYIIFECIRHKKIRVELQNYIYRPSQTRKAEQPGGSFHCQWKEFNKKFPPMNHTCINFVYYLKS